jgi:cell division protease FtsH
MVTIYGLNNKIGNITYYQTSDSEYGFTKPYSEETAKTIDSEISHIVEKEYNRAIQLLKKHKDKLTELAEYLLEKEVIFKDDLERIFGKRPFEKPEAEAPKEAAKPKAAAKKTVKTVKAKDSTKTNDAN